MERIDQDIIHIASFAGNIGDVINHEGFYKCFSIDEKRIEKIEMRRFYRNCRDSEKLGFDDRLIEKINSKKLLVLGGGGFFDVYWDESFTGTTFDMPKEFIDKIKIPVLVNAMGVHFIPGREKARHKFHKFFMDIKNRENWFVSIRNDGSYKRLHNVYGESVLKGVRVVPDNGFLFENNPEPKLPRNNKKRIGLSITNELLNPLYIGKENLDGFNSKVVKIIKVFLEKMEVCFFLHTPQDMIILNKLFSEIGIERMRKDVIISPFYNNGKELLRYYKSCDAVIGMRFHSSVMAIANSIPIIGLAMHEQISDLYEEIHYNKQCIKIGMPQYISMIELKMKEIFHSDHIINEEKDIMKDIHEKHRHYVSSVKTFLFCEKTIL